MIKQFTAGQLSLQSHRAIFKSLLFISNSTGLVLYGVIRAVFFDMPLVASEEITILLKLFLIGSLFAAGISILLLAADAAEFIIRKKKNNWVPAHVKTVSIALVAAIILLSACNTHVSVGIKKDFSTGLSSSYTNMEPEKVMLVMNNEVLNHTDIPLGESFLVVNDGITGLQPKNGKVRVGCSLTLSDQKGNVLLSEKDLFEGHDEFEEKDAKMLKCTVSTGEPMKWEEKYNVAVTFWDKNGTGKIENKVTIRSIDIP